jgi:hypothetical protein
MSRLVPTTTTTATVPPHHLIRYKACIQDVTFPLTATVGNGPIRIIRHHRRHHHYQHSTTNPLPLSRRTMKLTMVVQTSHPTSKVKSWTNVPPFMHPSCPSIPNWSVLWLKTRIGEPPFPLSF